MLRKSRAWTYLKANSKVRENIGHERDDQIIDQKGKRQYKKERGPVDVCTEYSLDLNYWFRIRNSLCSSRITHAILVSLDKWSCLLSYYIISERTYSDRSVEKQRPLYNASKIARPSLSSLSPLLIRSCSNPRYPRTESNNR